MLSIIANYRWGAKHLELEVEGSVLFRHWADPNCRISNGSGESVVDSEKRPQPLNESENIGRIRVVLSVG